MNSKKKPTSKEWKEQIEENLRAGLIELLILSTIVNEDMYVYDIKQRLEELSDDVFCINFGSMYRPLYRLLERNLVSSYKKVVGEKRTRIYYHLEESGREYFNHYLQMYCTYSDAANKVLASCQNRLAIKEEGDNQ